MPANLNTGQVADYLLGKVPTPWVNDPNNPTGVVIGHINKDMILGGTVISFLVYEYNKLFQLVGVHYYEVFQPQTYSDPNFPDRLHDQITVIIPPVFGPTTLKLVFGDVIQDPILYDAEGNPAIGVNAPATPLSSLFNSLNYGTDYYAYQVSLENGNDQILIGPDNQEPIEVGQGGTATIAGGANTALWIWHDKNVVGLQSHPRHEHHGYPAPHDGNEGIVRVENTQQSESRLLHFRQWVFTQPRPKSDIAESNCRDATSSQG
jgi:hypothetical protein